MNDQSTPTLQLTYDSNTALCASRGKNHNIRLSCRVCVLCTIVY